jgi:hypothetical protein
VPTTLQNDFKRNAKDLEAKIASGSIPPGVAKHLKETLWPLLSDIIDDIAEHRAETAELAEDVTELTERTEDLLHEDTATPMRNAIACGVALAAVLKARLSPSVPGDAELLNQIAAFEVLAAEAVRVIDEVTVPDGEDDDDEGDGAEGEDDDEESDEDEEDGQ